MSRKSFLVSSVVIFGLCAILAYPICAGAQDPKVAAPVATPAVATPAVAVPAVPVVAPAVTAVDPVVIPVTVPDVPTPENPMPDIVSVEKAIDYMLSNFSSVWYMLVAFCLYILISILRGKAKLFGWTVKIYKLSNWLDGAGSKVKLYLIIGMSAVGMGCFALKNVTTWALLPVAKIAISGMVSGVVIALTAMGVNTAKDVHTDPSHPERFDPKAPVDSDVTPVDVKK